MRQICRVQSISVGSFSKLFNLRGMASGWVGDEDARGATGTPTFGSLTYTPGELYANRAGVAAAARRRADRPRAACRRRHRDRVCRAEGAAFLSGSGVNRPTGILTYVTGAANAAVHPFGAVLVRHATGTAGALDKADDIVNLVYDLPSELTDGAQFLMNRNTTARSGC
jgi:HK97 family phage major capsid protein